MTSIRKAFRNALKTSIIDAEILTADQIVVQRQIYILEALAEATAKTAGLCLTIATMKGNNPFGDSPGLVFRNTMLLTLWTHPTLLPDSIDEEALFETLMKHVHHLELEGFGHPSKNLRRLQIDSFYNSPDDTFVRQDIIASNSLNLSPRS